MEQLEKSPLKIRAWRNFLPGRFLMFWLNSKKSNNVSGFVAPPEIQKRSCFFWTGLLPRWIMGSFMGTETQAPVNWMVISWRRSSNEDKMQSKRTEGFSCHFLQLSWCHSRLTSSSWHHSYWWLSPMNLQKKVRPAVRKKLPNLLDEGVLILHDNASPHFRRCVVEMLAQWEWEVLSHPPYSPDMSSCDFLLAAIKKLLCVQHFRSEEDINTVMLSGRPL